MSKCDAIIIEAGIGGHPFRGTVPRSIWGFMSSPTPMETVEKYIPGPRQNARWTNVMGVDQMDKMLGEDGAGIGIGQIAGQCTENEGYL